MHEGMVYEELAMPKSPALLSLMDAGCVEVYPSCAFMSAAPSIRLAPSPSIEQDVHINSPLGGHSHLVPGSQGDSMTADQHRLASMP